LGTTWVDHSDTFGDTSSMDANGIELGGPSGGGLGSSAPNFGNYAGVSTDVLNGFTPAELSTISYTESYTVPGNANSVAPYFKLKLQQGSDASTCGDDDVVYNPSVQSPHIAYAGETETFEMTAPYSTVGVDNDADPTDGSYPFAMHSVSNGASADVSGEQICLAEIVLGSNAAAGGAKATVDNVTFAGAGLPSRTYSFGS
jgi:hypothetical protein